MNAWGAWGGGVQKSTLTPLFALFEFAAFAKK